MINSNLTKSEIKAVKARAIDKIFDINNNTGIIDAYELLVFTGIIERGNLEKILEHFLKQLKD